MSLRLEALSTTCVLVLAACDDAPKPAGQVPAHGTVAVAEPQATPSPRSRWSLSTTKDPLLDTPRTIGTLQAEDSIDLASASLLIRCQENKTEVYVAWDKYLGLEETKVIWRLDSAPAQTDLWSLSTDGKATFYPSNVRDFITALEGATSLLIRVTPYREASIRARFLVSGIASVRDSVGATCGWKRADSATVAKAAAKKQAWNDRIAKAKWVGDQSSNLLYRDWPTCSAVTTISTEDRVVFKSKDEALTAGYAMNGYSGCGESPPRYRE